MTEQATVQATWQEGTPANLEAAATDAEYWLGWFERAFGHMIPADYRERLKVCRSVLRRLVPSMEQDNPFVATYKRPVQYTQEPPIEIQHFMWLEQQMAAYLEEHKDTDVGLIFPLSKEAAPHLRRFVGWIETKVAPQ